MRVAWAEALAELERGSPERNDFDAIRDAEFTRSKDVAGSIWASGFTTKFATYLTTGLIMLMSISNDLVNSLRLCMFHAHLQALRTERSASGGADARGRWRWRAGRPGGKAIAGWRRISSCRYI